MNDHIYILRRLKQEIDAAVKLADASDLVSMTDAETEAYKKQFGDFDLIVGEFGIKCLSYPAAPIPVPLTPEERKLFVGEDSMPL